MPHCPSQEAARYYRDTDPERPVEVEISKQFEAEERAAAQWEREGNGPPRPWCCPDRRCSPLVQVGEPDADAPGESFFCLGKMERETVFTYDGTEHRNDLSTCCYTPLKGILRFQENADDWFLMAHAYEQGLWLLAGKPDGLRPRRNWSLRKAAASGEAATCGR